jgi:hypothetical protein
VEKKRGSVVEEGWKFSDLEVNDPEECGLKVTQKKEKKANQKLTSSQSLTK